MPDKLWFKAKTYGYGWYPSSWEGWVVILAFVIVTIILGIGLDHSAQQSSDLARFYAGIAISAAVLIVICLKKGEKARWRWGQKDGAGHENGQKS